MSEENRTIMERIWEEFFNKRNPALAEELFAADFVNHSFPPGTPPGPEPMKEHVKRLMTGSPDFHVTVEDTVVGGDKVVTRTIFSGSHRGDLMGIPPTGKEFKQSQIHICRMAKGKVVEHWCVLDNLGLMQQLGVVPSPGQGGR